MDVYGETWLSTLGRQLGDNRIDGVLSHFLHRDTNVDACGHVYLCRYKRQERSGTLFFLSVSFFSRRQFGARVPGGACLLGIHFFPIVRCAPAEHCGIA